MKRLTILMIVGCLAGAIAGVAETTTPLPDQQAPLQVLTLQSQPFFYEDAEGRLKGLEYLILESFAASRNQRLEVQWLEGRIGVSELLAEGELDIFAASITITEERRRRYDFSVPYFPTMLLLVERQGEESRNLGDLSGKRVATARRTSYENILREIPGVERVYMDTSTSKEYAQELFSMVDDGRADALIIDSIYYLWMADQFPGLAPTISLSQRNFFGFALGKGSPLKAELDQHLETILRDGRLLGFLQEVFGKWGAEAVADAAEGFLDP